MKNLLAAISVAAATAFAIVHFMAVGPVGQKTEATYERVMSSRILRCGYNIWEPSIMQGADGKLSGAYVDFMEELGRSTNLKIEWTAQLDWGTFPNDLRDGKVDAMCAGVWADARRGTLSAWTTPVWYNIIDAYYKAGNPKFPNKLASLEQINDPAITIAVVEGTVPAQIVEKYYPKAQRYAVPSLAGGTPDVLMSVISGKADVAFMDTGAAAAFQKSNPVSGLEKLTAKDPIATYPQSIGIEIHESALQNLLNAATQELVQLGVAERIAKKYDPEGSNFVMGKNLK